MSITERTHSWAQPLSRRIGPPRGIVIHHSAASSSSAATIHSWHRGRGWSGIGYHFVVRKTGMIERGRPEHAIGAHTQNYNDRIGICCEGNLVHERMPQAQRDALSWLVHDYLSKYGRIPVTRHRDHASTACPGEHMPWPIPRPRKKEDKPVASRRDYSARSGLYNYTVVHANREYAQGIMDLFRGELSDADALALARHGRQRKKAARSVQVPQDSFGIVGKLIVMIRKESNR